MNDLGVVETSTSAGNFISEARILPPLRRLGFRLPERQLQISFTASINVITAIMSIQMMSHLELEIERLGVLRTRITARLTG